MFVGIVVLVFVADNVVVLAMIMLEKDKVRKGLSHPGRPTHVDGCKRGRNCWLGGLCNLIY